MTDKREQLLHLLQAASELAGELQAEIQGNASYRTSLNRTAVSLQRSLQAPGERTWEIFHGQTLLPLIRVALEAGWLDQVAHADSKGVKATDVASIAGSEASLVARVMRCLARADIVEEVEVQTYTSNSTTKLFTAPGMRHGVIHIHNCSASVVNMPLYFANWNYQSPPDAINNPYTFTEGTPMWKDLARQPDKQEAFNKFMGSVRHSKKDWHDTFPVQDLRVESDSDVLLIDIGGGLGHDLLGFDKRRQTLQLPGRLILQDRALVVAKVPEETKQAMTVMAHDFFTPQPKECQHARVYYLRMVLHDWPDAPCLTILHHIREAMKPGYSKLLINDLVLSEKDCPYHEAFFDIMMMAAVSGKQRTRQDWEELIGQVEGLKIEKVWPIDEGANYESVIEVLRSS